MNDRGGVYVKKELTEWLIAIAVGIILVILIINFVAKSYTIKGDSMNPTLKDGDHVLVNIIGYKVGTVKKGNVIVFHANQKDDYVKRVIGTPGDKVYYRDDQLIINGKKVKEPYLEYNMKRKQGEYITGSLDIKDLAGAKHNSNVIPQHKYLVLGDNREVSKDSRAFGLIDEKQIVGKVSLRFWPLTDFKFNFNPDMS